MKAIWIRLAASASAAAMLVLLTACGGEQPTADSGRAAGSEAATSTGDLNAYDAKALEFYSSFVIHGRALEGYKTLAHGVREASAAVVGTVVRLEKTRKLQGEVPDDQFWFVGVVIRPTEVLAGTLAPEFRSELTVEFVGDTGREDYADLEKLLPQGHQAVWILRHKADLPPDMQDAEISPAESRYFRVVSPQGLFAQGEQSVTTPLDEALPGTTNMGAEGRSFPQLSALVQEIRDLDPEP